MCYNSSIATLKNLIELLEDLYPLKLAEAWDHPGLIFGAPDSEINQVVLALDPVFPLLDWMKLQGFGPGAVIITHHPLFFRSVHKLGGDTFRGRFLNELAQNGWSLYNAHTNADAARDGVSDALAELLGVEISSPIVALPSSPELGLGRVGNLARETTLEDFARSAREKLPAGRVQVSGDLARRVKSVAVLGGAGDSVFDAVEKTGASVYLTSDLRHHPALDAKFERPFALINVPHYSSEFPWLPKLQRILRAALPAVPTALFETPTDPWDLTI